MDDLRDLDFKQTCIHEQMESHEVEKIREVGLDERGDLMFLVKWNGYSENQNSWEPIENLHTCGDLMTQIGFPWTQSESEAYSEFTGSSEDQFAEEDEFHDEFSSGRKAVNSEQLKVQSPGDNNPAITIASTQEMKHQTVTTKFVPISEYDVRRYFEQHEGSVQNQEILSYFRKPLCDPAIRDEARAVFTRILNKLSTCEIKQGVIWYTLKPGDTVMAGYPSTDSSYNGDEANPSSFQRTVENTGKRIFSESKLPRSIHPKVSRHKHLLDSRSTQLDTQLEFLVFKFLAEGSYGEAANVFKNELEKRQSIPTSRNPITGETVVQSFNAWSLGQLGHIGSGYLSAILQKLLLTHPELKEERQNLRLPPSLLCGGTVQFLKSRGTGRDAKWLSKRELGGGTSLPRHMFKRLDLAGRIIGHWDIFQDEPCPVKCVLFDRTGKYIFTGANDKVVKIWSATNGRLLTTLRGSTGEISGLAVNESNTIIAGSSGRFIFVWLLATGELVEVISLPSQASKVITVLFCPLPPQAGFCYLTSTHLDGSTAFWTFKDEIRSDIKIEPVLQLLDETERPGPVQVSCCSFSTGGAFMATGSADKHVRVFHMLDTDGPKRIFEKLCHSGRIDAIAWANRGLRFLSGSRDGTVLVWHFGNNNWNFREIACSHFASTKALNKPDTKRLQRTVRVNNVCWNCDDTLIVTSTSNNLVVVWERDSRRLVRVLEAHSGEVFVLAPHPIYSNVLCTAANDGKIILWDIGFLYDPDTTTATKLFTYENQLPFNGRELKILDSKWSPDGLTLAATDEYGHLIIFSMDGHPRRFEHLPREMFFHTDYWSLTTDAITGTVLDERTQIAPHLLPPPLLINKAGETYPMKMQRLVPGRENLLESQLMDISLSYCNIIHSLVLHFAPRLFSESEKRRFAHMEEENCEFEAQKHRRPDFSLDFVNKDRQMDAQAEQLQNDNSYFPSIGVDVCQQEQPASSNSSPDSPHESTHRNSPENASRGPGEARYSFRRQKQLDFKGYFREQISEPPTEPEFNPNSLSESSESDTDSSMDGGVVLGSLRERLKNDVTATSVRKRQTRSKPIKIPIPEDSGPESLEEHDNSAVAFKKAGITKLRNRRTAKIPRCVTVRPALSDWHLSETQLKGPFVPQLGDALVLIRQGYQRYVEHIKATGLFKLSSRYVLCHNWKSSSEDEVPVRVNNMKFQNYPSVFVVIELLLQDWQSNELNSEVINVCYSNVPEVADFLVPRHVYDKSMEPTWNIGDRFRCIRNECWVNGVIQAIGAFSLNFPLSKFHSLKTLLTNGVENKLSPWDIEKIADCNGVSEVETSNGVAATEMEIRSRLYECNALDWPPYGYQEAECNRISRGVTDVMLLSAAEPFLAPVDLSLCPDYRIRIHYPVDLSLIKSRLDCRFYRRIEALYFDLQQLQLNAESFYSPGSDIVKKSRIICELCKLIVQDKITDLPAAYRHLDKTFDWRQNEIQKLPQQCSKSGPSKKPTKNTAVSSTVQSKRSAMEVVTTKLWNEACLEVLEEMWNDPCGQAFQQPVNPVEQPEYFQIVSSPMDLQSIKEDLLGGNYVDPLEFSKDVQQMFSNSTQYNKDRNPDLHIMSETLEQLFDSKMPMIIKEWKRLNKNSASTIRKPIKFLARKSTRIRQKVQASHIELAERNSDMSQQNPGIDLANTVDSQEVLTSNRIGLKRKRAAKGHTS